MIDEDEVLKLYVDDRYSLRAIAKEFNTSHHTIHRILDRNGVEVDGSTRVRPPFTKSHRQKISQANKGRQGIWYGKKMPKSSLYKNMAYHLRWDVDAEWLSRFDDIEKLKFLNKILSRDRVAINFDDQKYKAFIAKFYSDPRFNVQFNIYMRTKDKYDRPSLDHIIPLSRGGTWDLENLQIISWFENRAKCDLTNDEFSMMVQKYFNKEC